MLAAATKEKQASNVPEVLGVPVSTWALLVSLLALLVAASSFLVAWLTYRRNGARIRVRVDPSSEVGKDPVIGPYMKSILLVTVMNTGQAAVEVRNISWRVKSKRFGWERDHLMVLPQLGDPDSWPRTVGGSSEELFPYDRQVFETNVGLADRSVQLQAQIVLAGGKRKRSNRVTLDPVQTAVSGRDDPST